MPSHPQYLVPDPLVPNACPLDPHGGPGHRAEGELVDRHRRQPGVELVQRVLLEHPEQVEVAKGLDGREHEVGGGGDAVAAGKGEAFDAGAQLAHVLDGAAGEGGGVAHVQLDEGGGESAGDEEDVVVG